MNPFLEACGARGPLLLNVEAPGSAAEARAFDLPFVLVGRDPRCDLRLDHPEVSPRHAYLQVVDGRLLYADLGSRGGVYQGGKRRRLGRLDRESAVRIGPYRVRLLSGDNDVSTEDFDPDHDHDERPSGRLAFELSHRSVRSSRCRVGPGLGLAGSAADCDVRLIDPSVASYHCAFVPTPGGVWVVDLLGQGGVRVNGHEASYARLAGGDAVLLGHSLIKLVDAEPTRDSQGVTPTETEAAWPGTAAGRLFDDPPPGLAPVSLSHHVNGNGSGNGDGRGSVHARFEDGFVFGKATARPGDRDPRPGSESDSELGFATGAETGTGLALPVSQAAGMAERLLAPMIGQIGLMREQMAEELRQSRAAMHEMFSALRQEQAAALDDELRQLREASRDLNLLRADLDRQTRNLAVLTARLPDPATATNVSIVSQTLALAPAPAPVAVAALPRPVKIPDRILAEWAPDAGRRALSAAPPPRVAPNHPEATVVRARGRLPGGPPAALRPERSGPVVIPPFPVPQAVPPTPEGAASVGPGPAPRPDDEGLDKSLCERIVPIREAHRSLWQKLLSRLPGAPARKGAH